MHETEMVLLVAFKTEMYKKVGHRRKVEAGGREKEFCG